MSPWDNLKCDVYACDAPVRVVAVDIIEITAAPGQYPKTVAGNAHLGCAEHPVRSKKVRLDGSVVWLPSI
jgi:hypothetical protein